MCEYCECCIGYKIIYDMYIRYQIVTKVLLRDKTQTRYQKKLLIQRNDVITNPNDVVIVFFT